MSAGHPSRIVIAGGGVAGMETVLALRALAGPRVPLTVVAPDERFALRAWTVAEPFAAGHADVGPFCELLRAQGAEVRRTTVVAVDPDARTVALADGGTLAYEQLVLAMGARARAPFAHGLTFGLGDPFAFHGLLADLEEGYADAVAFVVPGDVTWTLPLYELALLTRAQVRGMGREVALDLYTPEPAPLHVLGPAASDATAELLREAGIGLHPGTAVAVGRRTVHVLADGAEAEVDRVVTLPVLEGPRLAGVPADVQGFIPVDDHGRVLGLQHVWAIGDAADHLVKQGGLACEQADAAAADIAARHGADVEVRPAAAVLRGRLLTGGAPRFAQRDASGSTVAEHPLWWPPEKVAGRYLGPWLAALRGTPERVSVSPRPPRAGVEVEVPVARRRHSLEILGLEPYGRMKA